VASDFVLVAGRYRLESVLGEGGMGTIWTGRDELLGRRVAVKQVRIPPGLPDRDREVLHERMMREARLTARLNDPRVITVYDVVLHEDQPYIVMELVPSRSLDQELDASGPLAPQRVARIGLDLLGALDLAHREGIVHRDIKPSNVLLADDGRVVLTDFGIATTESDATLTSTGLLVGSPTYMSPERLRGEYVGPKADLWSLGATLYAATEASPPFRAPTTMGTITAILTADLRTPEVGGSLREVLLGLLEKDPDQRLDSAQARTLLQRAVDEPGGATSALPAQAPVMSPVIAPTGAAAPAAAPSYVWVTEDDDDLAAPSPSPLSSPAAAAPMAADFGHERADDPDASGSGSRWLPLLAGLAILALLLGGLVAWLTGFGFGGGLTDDGGTVAGGASTQTDVTPSSDPPTDSEKADVKPDDDEKSDDKPEGGEDKPEDDKSDETAPPDSPETEDGVPDGFRLHTDELGFTVAVPKGWERRVEGSQVDFVSPEGSAFLRVDQVAQAGSDAAQAWYDNEDSTAARLGGYERIRIEPVDFGPYEAADWEFTWEGSTGTRHVLNRGIITDPRGFAIYVSTLEQDWDSTGLAVFDAATDAFAPAG
jgi:tRNA A-37 threonylcarbamoyl transferase component Bud32